jgi:nucleoside-diphosphate-sugar epimerase
VLVTGSEGYLGALVVPLLVTRGHEVVGFDTGFYGDGLLHGAPVSVRTARKDIRVLDEADLEGVDAIVHLAELSNDPVGQLSPAITYEINHEGSVRLAKLAKARGITRFVYTSSCSVYGVASDTVDESSPLRPQTVYAICKTWVERDVGALADDDFSPTFLRNATAFGISPMMRFDLVLNNLAGLAWTTGEIRLTSDGTPWRPLVHGLDVADAIARALDAPRERVHGEILNVGSTEQNYTIRELADVVGEVFTGCRVSFGEPSADQRSYRVAFDKIRSVLSGFECAWDARRGARQLFDLFSEIDLQPETFEFRAYTRLAQLRHLLQSERIDERFFWIGRLTPTDRSDPR